MSRELVVTYAAPAEHLRTLEQRLPDWRVTVVPDDARIRTMMLGDAEFVFSFRWSREVPEQTAFKRLRFVQFLSSGLDHVDLGTLPSGAVVAGNAGAYSTAMAEHAVALTLALAKHLRPAQDSLAAGRFPQATAANTLLAGKTATILGLGGVGTRYAAIARCLGMRMVAINRSGRSTLPLDGCGTLADLPELLPAADVLLISLPLNDVTRGLIGAQELAAMPPAAILVNVARAGIVDEDALFRHLQRVPSFRAGLDVWWHEPGEDEPFRPRHPFASLPNVVGTPHVSARVEQGLAAGVERAADNIARFAAGDTPHDVVTWNNNG